MSSCDCVTIREDINFLENPVWIVSKRDFLSQFTLEKIHGSYEIKSLLELPTRLDKLVLYYLVSKIANLSEEVRSLEITRYEIAKNVFPGVSTFSNAKYARIMLALNRLQAAELSFIDSFYEDGELRSKNFSIIEKVLMDEHTKKLVIYFNAEYLKQLRNTRYHAFINFKEYRRLTRPVSVRLYEILIAKMKDKSTWYIESDKLGELMVLEKRRYPSQIIAALKPALDEINQKTTLAVSLVFNKELNLCVFKYIKNQRKNA